MGASLDPPAPADLASSLTSRLYLDILARNVLKLRSLVGLVRDRGLHEAIFCDYWFNSTLALALLRRSGEIRTAIARAHRFDIYDEAWGGHPVPFRAAKAQGLDAVFAVSDFGAAYLERHVRPLRGKVTVGRLGVVQEPGIPSQRRRVAAHEASRPAGGGDLGHGPLAEPRARRVGDDHIGVRRSPVVDVGPDDPSVEPAKVHPRLAAADPDCSRP